MAVDANTIVSIYEMVFPAGLVPYVLLGVTTKFVYDVYEIVTGVLSSTVNKK